MKRLVALLVLTVLFLPLVETCLPGRAEAIDVRTSLSAIKLLWAGDQGCGDTSTPVPPPSPPPPPSGMTLTNWVQLLLALF